MSTFEELELSGSHQELGVQLIQRLSTEPSLELFKRAVSSLLIAGHPDVVLQLLTNIINQSPEVAAELSPYHYFALVLAGQDSRAAMVLQTLRTSTNSSGWASRCAASDREFRLTLVAAPEHAARSCKVVAENPVVVEAACPRCAKPTNIKVSQILAANFIPCAKCAFPFFVLPQQLAPVWPTPLAPRERVVLENFGIV